MAYFPIFAVFALAFVFLFVRDLRGREISFVSLRLQRSHNPVVFWGIVGFELVGFLYFGLSAWLFYTYEPVCDLGEVCVVTVRMAPA